MVKYKDITDVMNDTYIKKNNDYGNSFDKSIEKYGVIAALVRMSDKWERLNNLLLHTKSKVSDESVEDTLIDLASYSVMLTLYLKNNKNNNNEVNKTKL